MPLSAQAAVNDPTSIPTGESAVRVLSTLVVAGLALASYGRD